MGVVVLWGYRMVRDAACGKRVVFFNRLDTGIIGNNRKRPTASVVVMQIAYMENQSYSDRAWELGFHTLEMVNRMNRADFVLLVEEMMKTARQVSTGSPMNTREEMYDAYQRCLRLMSYLQAVEDMGIISSAEYKDLEIQILALTNQIQGMYKKAQC